MRGNEPSSSVENCIDKTLGKFSAYSESYSSSLDQVINHVKKIHKELITDAEPDMALSVTGIILLEGCAKKIHTAVDKMGTEHREMHGGVSKCGKEIDKNFISDFTGVCKGKHNSEPESDLDENVTRLIAEHFMNQGYLDIAEILAKESGISLNQKNKEIFTKMNSILGSLKQRDLNPALQWAEENSDRLHALGSRLEFSLHKLAFIQLLREGAENQGRVLEYCRTFERFAPNHALEIQQLVGGALYLRQGLDNSPYAHLLSDILWPQIQDIFTRDACALLGLPVNSPLSICLNAGTVALPSLLNLRQAMQQRHVIGVWGNSDELPIEIDLGSEHHYHSVFACPILRQQTTEENYPMRLSCGHVISRDALTKLASNNRSRLKCPYCPMETVVNDAIQVFF